MTTRKTSKRIKPYYKKSNKYDNSENTKLSRRCILLKATPPINYSTEQSGKKTIMAAAMVDN